MIKLPQPQRWPLTDADRKRIVVAVLEILDSPDERVRLAAVRAALAMEAQNQRDDHHKDAPTDERKKADQRIWELLNRRQ